MFDTHTTITLFLYTHETIIENIDIVNYYVFNFYRIKF